MAEPRFLFLLTSCSCPVCAPTWKNYQQHHCVFFYSKKKKKYFGTFYFKSHSIFVMRRIKIDVYNQINRRPVASFHAVGGGGALFRRLVLLLLTGPIPTATVLTHNSSHLQTPCIALSIFMTLGVRCCWKSEPKLGGLVKMASR